MDYQNQYNASNAWNVNLNNGNVNNNTKTNGNQVRLVSEFCKDPEAPGALAFLEFVTSFMEAYKKCIKTKIHNPNAAFYALRGLISTVELAEEVWNETYEIRGGIAFTVRKPVWRECFAATLRDRIPHDWVMDREIPVFETFFSDAITANRKGMGTSYAIEKVEAIIREMTEDYTRNDLWLFMGDFQGFFMNIDKRILMRKVWGLNAKYYRGPWPEILDRLFAQITFNCPQEKAVKRSPQYTWDEYIAPEKSLYGRDKWHGLAIGNLPSQWSACVIIMMAVEIFARYGIAVIITCMDDFIAFVRDKEEFLRVLPAIERDMKEELNITLHPRKRNLQHYTKGWKFVGAKGRNGRKYVSDRTIRSMRARLHYLCSVHDLEGVWRSVNSYFGIMAHYATYNIRKREADLILAEFGRELYFDGNLTRSILRKRYNQRERVKQAIRLSRKQNINQVNQYRNVA